MKQLVTILFLFGYLTTMAQSDDRLEKFKALKVAFITEKLDLSSKEAQSFWPIYNKYSDDSEKIREQQRQEYRQNVKQGEKLSDLADEVSEKFVASFLSGEEEQLRLKKQLVSGLKSVISSKKIWRLIRAEDEFKQKMIEEFKKRREKMQEMRKNRN
jgi:Skp family chaperone for outer membrane proteins